MLREVAQSKYLETILKNCLAFSWQVVNSVIFSAWLADLGPATLINLCLI